MNLRKLYYLLLIVPMLFVYTGCKDEDNPVDPTVNESEVLVKYLEANGDFINTAAPAMISATDVNTNILSGSDQVVIDIRGATDYANGHIKNAINLAEGEVLAYYEANGLESKSLVVIACYSGQTAGFVTSLLRLAGKTNVKDLKWGMCSWNQLTSGGWTNARGNGKRADFVTTATAKPAAGNLPKLSTGKTDGAAILRARIETVAAQGFAEGKISNTDLYNALSNYFVMNYWSSTDYSWGHINGAMQYTPGASLKLDADLNTISTEKPVVVYCYTGQTSAHVTAYLRVLGYNAKSLLYGVNAMCYDDMPGTRFVPESEIHDFELVQ